MESKEKNPVEEQGLKLGFFVRLKINFNRCNNCGKSAQVCLPGVLIMVNNQLEIADKEQSDKCAKYLRACPNRAISLNQKTE